MTDVQTPASGLPQESSPPKLDPMQATRATWRVFRWQPWMFIWLLIIPVLVGLPIRIVESVLQLVVRGMAGKNSTVAIAIIVLVSLVGLVVQYAAQFTCQIGGTWGAAQNMQGSRFATGDALRIGFGRVLPYFGLFLLMMLIIVIGFLLLIIPGIILAGFLGVAPAACVLERRGPIDSIRRSFSLVSGNWWRCFALGMLTIVLPFLAFAATVLVAYLVFAALGVKWLTLIMILPAIPFFIVMGAIVVVVPAVMFIELRRAKEGGGPHGAVAGVFE